ncbi:MAG: restriction endonuclease subunit S [Confluentibacter sp.]|nr:restriction endonuclease subunit S [Confluentibacter sp.]
MEFITINDLSTVVRGSSPRPKGDPKYYGGSVPRLMVSDVTRDGMYVTPSTDSLTLEGAKKSRPMEKGELVIAVSGDPGEPSILNVNACIHDGFVGLRNLDAKRVFTPYLYRFFKFNKLINKSQAVGAIYKNLNTDQIKSLKIPLPNLETQKRIAAILDEADTLRQLNQQLIAKYDALTQSLFLDMFGDPVTNSMGWEKVAMSKICDLKKKTIKPENISTNTKYIPLDAIEKETGKIIGYEIVECGDIKSNKFYFTNEHILYGKLRPYLNKVSLPNFEGICSTDIIPLKPIPNKTNRFFIAQIMRGNGFVSFASERSSGANLPRISPDEIQKHKIINPPIHLQTQFAERVQVIEQQKQQAQDALQKSELLFNSLLQKAFNGTL